VDLNVLSWGLRKKMGIPTCDGVGGPCQRLGKTRYQNTMYLNDEDNIVHMCDQCAAKNDDYWQEMWDEYNRGRI